MGESIMAEDTEEKETDAIKEREIKEGRKIRWEEDQGVEANVSQKVAVLVAIAICKFKWPSSTLYMVIWEPDGCYDVQRCCVENQKGTIAVQSLWQ